MITQSQFIIDLLAVCKGRIQHSNVADVTYAQNIAEVFDIFLEILKHLR